jgi:hypothetical protein
MLSEKFILVLEALLKSQSHSDGAPHVVTTSPHVPIKLPAAIGWQQQGEETTRQFQRGIRVGFTCEYRKPYPS